jgi:hypothetical protein
VVSPLFRYRKLYTDLVTDQGTVCVGYASWLSFLGYELCSAGFELYPSDGERRVVRARGPVSVVRGDDHVRLSFDTHAGPFSIALQGSSTQRHPAPLSLTGALTWRVLLTNARACVQGPESDHERSGSGYADLVEMTRPPRSLGLSRLEWGRGHAAHESFVFTQARFRDGRVFRSALRDGAPVTELELSRAGQGDLAVRLPGGAISLHDRRVLHRGSALDSARFPARTERALARLCAGRVEETRWLAQATFPSGACALALHERVQLGP